MISWLMRTIAAMDDNDTLGRALPYVGLLAVGLLITTQWNQIRHGDSVLGWGCLALAIVGMLYLIRRR